MCLDFYKAVAAQEFLGRHRFMIMLARVFFQLSRFGMDDCRIGVTFLLCLNIECNKCIGECIDRE